MQRRLVAPALLVVTHALVRTAVSSSPDRLLCDIPTPALVFDATILGSRGLLEAMPSLLEAGGADLEAAIYAVEELEETAKLALMMRGMQHKVLTDTQITDLVQHFSLEWD